MLKNIASQVISALLLDTLGAPVTTGTTSVYVTGDAGTQSLGGTAIHEGNGLWTFLPSQANTNYDHIAFTFVNGGAVNSNIQLFTGVNVAQIAGSTTAAVNHAAASDIVLQGTTDGVTATTTYFTTDLTTTVNDQLNLKTLVFKSDTATVALRGQARPITGSLVTGGVIYIAIPLTQAPGAADTFVVV